MSDPSIATVAPIRVPLPQRGQHPIGAGRQRLGVLAQLASGSATRATVRVHVGSA